MNGHEFKPATPEAPPVPPVIGDPESAITMYRRDLTVRRDSLQAQARSHKEAMLRCEGAANEIQAMLNQLEAAERAALSAYEQANGKPLPPNPLME